MKPQDTCPTCGTALGPLHDKDSLRRCSSCNRINPRGFYYCGYCAAPMETTAHRAELAEVAAPPGGWPSLARELVEVRFYTDRGELDEAFELIAILRERYPGHPELAELQRSATDGRPRPDTQVNRVVDSVLSGSAGLSGAMPRRAAPQWNAPEASEQRRDDGRTRGHEVVPRATRSEEGAAAGSVTKHVVQGGEVRKVGSFPAVGQPMADDGGTVTDVQSVVPPRRTPPRGGARPVKTQTDKHLFADPQRAKASAPSTAAVEEAAPAEVAGEIDQAAAAPTPEVDPAAPSVVAQVVAAAPAPGLTVAVPTLQPAAPYRESISEEIEIDEDASTDSRSAVSVHKRVLKSRKRSTRQPSLRKPPPERERDPAPRRRRGNRFGSHVLVRLGGKE